MYNDKKIELERYESKSKNYFKSKEFFNKPKKSLPQYLQYIYTEYYETIISELRPTMQVLELGAGTGEHTKCLLDSGAFVTALDISPSSLAILELKHGHYSNLKTLVIDMECINLPDNSFDLICCAGSIAYADWIVLRDQIFKLLKPGGSFVLVDVFNKNPIYRLNRYVHYLKGNRSRSVTTRTPNKKFVSLYALKFSVKLKHVGSLVFLCPILSFLLGDQAAYQINKYFDKNSYISPFAFKIIMTATKI